MKKILISFLLIIPLVLTGCSSYNSNISKGKESLKVEVLSKDKYLNKLNELLNETILPPYYLSTNPQEFQGDKYTKKYEKYKNYDVEKQNNLADRDRYKDFLENITKFKPNDDDMNRFHNRIIKYAVSIRFALEEAGYYYDKYLKTDSQSYDYIYLELRSYAELNMEVLSYELYDFIDFYSNKKDNNQNTSEKEEYINVQILSKGQYINKLKRLVSDTIFPSSYLPYDYSKFKGDNYTQKYKGYKTIRQRNLADRDRYKDFLEVATTFKSNDENINKFHNKIIEYAISIQFSLEKLEYFEYFSTGKSEVLSDSDKKFIDKYDTVYEDEEHKYLLLIDYVNKNINELYNEIQSFYHQ